MFNSDDQLDIFESFLTDFSLPKHMKTEMVTGLITDVENGETRVRGEVLTSVMNSGMRQSNWAVSGGRLVSMDELRQRRWWHKLSDWWQDKRRMPIDTFFKSVKNGVEELELVEHRMQGFLVAIEKAKENGQAALFEQLQSNVEGVRAETQLVAMKQVKYIEESRLVEFVKKAKKGLRLDWVGNFARTIPDDVTKKKLACDERRIFDNYVVLHYDPNKKSYAETQAQKEAKKDPILFGVIKGRRRLYFVGDWVDEFCDLTLDQIADALGKDAITTLPKNFTP